MEARMSCLIVLILSNLLHIHYVYLLVCGCQWIIRRQGMVFIELGYFLSPASSACTLYIFSSLMTTSYDLMHTLIWVLRKVFCWFLISILTKSEFESWIHWVKTLIVVGVCCWFSMFPVTTLVDLVVTRWLYMIYKSS